MKKNFYSDWESFHTGGKDSNLILGAIVTCYALLKLYEEISKLEDRVLYNDTDSIVFISRNGQCESL